MKEKFFSIDSSTILALGRDSIRDATTALIEFVKNSYDADATQVEIEIISNTANPYIRIADNGHGMTEEELETRWLRIGFSKKKTDFITKSKRRTTGEKGIGRISADRLGRNLVLKTKAKSESAVALYVDWDAFDRKGHDLTKIPVKFDQKDVGLKVPEENKSKSGTEIIIHDLRQTWTKSDLEKLYSELAVLTPPIKGLTDFQIKLESDVSKDFNGIVQSSFYEKAEVELEAKFNGKEMISYSIKSRIGKDRTVSSKIEWNQLSHKIIDPYEIETGRSLECGPATVRLLFYRRSASSLEGTGFSLSGLREFLNRNAGVKIYRDNIRVKPYGDAFDTHGDWLSLGERKAREPAAISRPTYKVAPSQVIGAIFIGRDSNMNLIDSSSREGLIESKSFYDLRALALSCVTLLESEIYELNKSAKKAQKKTPEEEISAHKQDLYSLSKDLKKIKDKMPTKLQAAMERVLEKVDTLKEDAQSLSEIISEYSVLRGLATIGISSAVFGHETQSSITEFKAANSTAIAMLKANEVSDALLELEDAQRYADQVSAWGVFALSRVQKDKRVKKMINVDEVILRILDQLEPAMKSVDIEIIQKISPIKSKVFIIDIESIFLNLLTNAYYFCQQSTNDRKIAIRLHQKADNKNKGYELTVSDSGPGIDNRFLEKIWEPLFTTKKDTTGREVGTGLGLTIVKSAVKDGEGNVSVDVDEDLSGAKFSVWLPII